MLFSLYDFKKLPDATSVKASVINITKQKIKVIFLIIF
ncbi:hypothetical protein VFMJ11_1212 [Aliivibrio fischeri MJ11]|uniref:Uncharacterized protein n=1 Tax=Aliivibrio fischeri (strain MJ11) TaxID=388396 RepID=B5FDL9_ALIFM|nr:hypothetical protein VFMJ11_1212 [Aliivibrio fischeri MJ11]